MDVSRGGFGAGDRAVMPACQCDGSCGRDHAPGLCHITPWGSLPRPGRVCRDCDAAKAEHRAAMSGPCVICGHLAEEHLSNATARRPYARGACTHSDDDFRRHREADCSCVGFVGAPWL